MASTTTLRLRVAICGGGIGGLSLACALSRIPDIAVDIYEAASEFQEIGTGVMLRPRNLRFLAELGLMDDIAAINGRSNEEKKGAADRAMVYYKGNQPELGLVTFMSEASGSVMCHRAEFHSILLQHIPDNVGLHKQKRVISYPDTANANSPVRLFFADGTEATCDVLVGADGIKSVVRTSMLNELAERAEDKDQADRLRERVPPRYSGVVTHRIVLPREKFSQLPPDSSVWTMAREYLGDKMSFITYPISQGRLLNVVIVTVNFEIEWTLHPQPWVTYIKADEFMPLVEGWAEEPRGIIAGLEGTELKKWVVNVVKPLNEWSVGRVTLLGDAAHAMVPLQGAGAGQAIEDAQVLSVLFAHPSTTRFTVHHALRAYSEVRMPIAAKFFAASRRNGEIMTDMAMPMSECAAQLLEAAEDAWRCSPPAVQAQRAVDTFETALADTV